MSRRTLVPIVALALGGFGIGATEFAVMGLLPEIAGDLLPALTARSQDAALGRASLLISAYALGVVVGAPTIAAAAARYARRPVLIWLSIAFTTLTALTAFAPTFETAVAARLLAGLPHGAYFGIAGLAAADMMGPGSRGRGAASVLLGLSVSNIVGVPLITAAGQQFGWRVAFLLIAAIFAATAVAIALTLPASAGRPGGSIRTELRALRSGRLWLGVGIGAIGFGGFFAVYSYLSPMVTELAGLGSGAVPWALATVGLGMTIGNIVGGRLADRNPLGTLGALMPVFAVLLAVFALTAQSPAVLFVGCFLFGFITSTMAPSVQVRLMDVASEAQTLAAALNHSALNIGNSLGAALGGAVVAAGLGLRAPIWVGVLLSVLGFAIVLWSRAADRRAGGLPAS